MPPRRAPARASLARLVAGASIALTVALSPGAARADHAVDTARAEALFEEGRRLMASRDFAAACAKLAESEQLDPAPGTLLNLAVCYERAGRSATAWATYKSAALAAQRAGQADRASAAATKATELEATLSRVTIEVPAASRIAGLEVRCDGQPVREPTWGVALPYDPGSHAVEAVAPGRRAWTSRVELGATTQRVAVSIPDLALLPVVPAAAPKVAGADDAREEGTGSQQRLGGVVLASVGAAAMLGAAFAGMHAKSVYDSALAACNGGTVCPDDHGLSLRNEASTWATLSTIGFIAGGAVLAGGAIVFLTAPTERALAIGPSPVGTGVAMTGRF